MIAQNCIVYVVYYQRIYKLIKQFILQQFIKNMQHKFYKLPPLPLKREELSQMGLKFQRINIRPKFSSIQSQEDVEMIERERLSVKMSRKNLSSKRPLSTKSSQSTDSREQKNTARDISYKYFKKGPFVGSQIPLGLSLPTVTAKSWVVYQMRNNKYICGKRNYKKKEIASLTKMMTLIAILQLTEQFNINPSKLKVKASKYATCIIGTTAELRTNGEYSLNDLYYGMMLPSGNDAAFQIAQIGGALLAMQRQSGRINLNTIYNIDSMTQYYRTCSSSIVNIFLGHMNRIARNKIFMNTSNFVNLHGLSNTSNLSTADDLAKLCTYAMRNSEFRKIVNTQVYDHRSWVRAKKQFDKLVSQETIESDSNIGDSSERTNSQISVKQEIISDTFYNHRWENTNKMLGEGWSGIKTGITPNAGPCLAASFEKTIAGKQYELIVVLLNSQSMDSRWQQVRDLVRWTIEQGLYC